MPAGVQTSLDPVTAPELEIYRYTLESDTKNLMELSEIQRWIVQPALRQVQGVADDDNFGGFTRQFRLDLDPTELLRYGLGINDVINAINNNTANAGGGRVPRGDQSFIVRGVGLVRNLDDLGNVVVTQTNSMPVLVRDLGTLSYAHQEPEGILGLNANPATIEGIVTALKYANVSEVIAGIHRQGGGAAQATRAPGRSHRSCSRPQRSRRRDREQDRQHAARRHRLGDCRPHTVPRQPA